MRYRIILGLLFSACLLSCGGEESSQDSLLNHGTTDSTSLVSTTQLEELVQVTTTTSEEQIVEVIPTTTLDASWDGPLYPLTGLPAYEGIPQGPAVAVKVGNNDRNSLPHYGLREADIVYEVRIENGRSRFLAVYHSRFPEKVLPVRSARSSDIDLLLNLNHPVFVYWGANDIVLSEIQVAEWGGGFDSRSASSQWGERYFERDSSRSRPDNGYVDPDELQETASNEAEVPFPLFEYGDSPETAVPAAGARWEISQRTVDYVWNAPLEQWVRYQDGTLHLDQTGAPLTVDNLLFLYTSYRTSDADPTSPQAIRIGTGDGWVLRDGTVTGVVWERQRTSHEWKIFDDETGEAITLDVGTTWVTLARPGEGSILSSETVVQLIG